MDHYRHRRVYTPTPPTHDIATIVGLGLLLGAVGFGLLYGLALLESATLDHLREAVHHLF